MSKGVVIYNNNNILNIFEQKNVMFSMTTKVFNNTSNVIFKCISKPTVVKKFKFNKKTTKNTLTWTTSDLTTNVKYKTIVKTIGAYNGFDVNRCKSSPMSSKYIGVLSQTLHHRKVGHWSVSLIFNKIYSDTKPAYINKPNNDNYDYVQFIIKPFDPKTICVKDITLLKNILETCKKMASVKGGSYIPHHIVDKIRNLPIRVKHNSDLFIEQRTLNKNVYYNEILQNPTEYYVAQICKGIPYIILFIGDIAYCITKNIVNEIKIKNRVDEPRLISAIKCRNSFIIKRHIMIGDKYLINSDINRHNKDLSELTGWKCVEYVKLNKNYCDIINSFELSGDHNLLEFSKINGYYKNEFFIWSNQPIPITLLCKKIAGSYILYATATKRYLHNTGIKKIEEDRRLFSPTDAFHQPIRFSPSTDPFAYKFDSELSLDNQYISLTYDYKHLTWQFIEMVKPSETMLFGDDFKYIETNTWNLYRNPITKQNLCIDSNILAKQMYFVSFKSPMYYAPIKMNNMVKHSLIKSDTTVIDLASGRGSDLQTYKKLNVQNLLFCEIDNDAIDTLTHRKYDKLQNNTTLSIFSTDLNIPYASNLEVINNKYNFKKVNHIYSFFALHYLTGTKKNINNIACLISNLLTKGGLFTYTSFDKTAINELLKDGKWEVFENGIKKYSICHKKKNKSINLILPFNVNTHYYTEELIDDKLLDAAFKKQKMVVVKEARFMSCENEFRNKQPKLYNQLTPDDKIFINLYKYKIYKKI